MNNYTKSDWHPIGTAPENVIGYFWIIPKDSSNASDGYSIKCQNGSWPDTHKACCWMPYIECDKEDNHNSIKKESLTDYIERHIEDLCKCLSDGFVK